MPRYIDAAILDEAKFEKPSTAFERGWNAAMAAIFKNAPIADVAEVVRCKDCVYAIPYNERWTLPKKNNCLWCKLYEDIRTPCWFCADGERRDDGQTH